MKLSAVTFALMLASASASASASITTFGTKNNTYTPPPTTVDTVTNDLRDRFSVCPNIHIPLPVRIVSQEKGAYVRTNFFVVKTSNTHDTPVPYGKIMQKLSEAKHSVLYDYWKYDTSYNYIPHMNNEFKSYILDGKGTAPRWRRTFYSDLMGRRSYDSDYYPIYISPTYEMQYSNFDGEFVLPTRDFDVLDIMISNQNYDLWHATPKWPELINELTTYQGYKTVEARVTFYKKYGAKNTLNYTIWQRYPDNPVWTPSPGGIISAGSIDIRSIRNIQIGFDTVNKKTYINLMINKYGQSAYKLSATRRGWDSDPEVSYELYKNEEKMINDNKCFY
ncbi:hypothetical protein ACVTD9_05735 [Vibrio cholerae]